MSDIQVQLGDLTLTGLEIPERMPFGVKQAVAVQKLIGGARVVDSMGRDDDPLTWSGYFTGGNALDRALYLHNLCVIGQPITLSWDQLNYLVVIDSFTPNYAFAYRIPYEISCTVVQDNTSPVTSAPDSDIDDQMGDDSNTLGSLSSSIGDTTLGSLIGSVQSAVGAVASFVNAGASVVASVLQPIQAAQSRVGVLLGASIASTANVTGAGGVVAGVPVAQMIASMGAQVSAFSAQPALLSMTSVLGRMASNLNSQSNNSTTVTTAGGSLFDIASRQYGDPSSWTAIANANGLSDPELSGVQTLTVPTQPDTAGGVLVG
jgi:hypothetical protein